MPTQILSVARPTNDIDRSAGFYLRGLGFDVLAQFADHNGFDDVVLGHPEYPWHIELTHQHGVTVADAPTKEHLLVIFLPTVEEWEAAVARMLGSGAEPEPEPVPSENLYLALAALPR